MENGQPHTECSAKSHIQIDSHIKEITRLTNKEIYWMLLTGKTEKPKAQIKFEVNNSNIRWALVCTNIYSCLLDTYSRQFKYRLIHNYLTVKKIYFD